MANSLLQVRCQRAFSDSSPSLQPLPCDPSSSYNDLLHCRIYTAYKALSHPNWTIEQALKRSHSHSPVGIRRLRGVLLPLLLGCGPGAHQEGVQMVATKGGARLCSGAASHVSILEDWLYSLVKSFSYWPRRGPRGAWGAEEGLVEPASGLASWSRQAPVPPPSYR